MTTLNQIQTTIADQINARELHFAKFMLITMDANTVRVHKGKKSLDITYCPGSDTYTVNKIKIKPDFTCTQDKMDNIYFDDLKPIIQDFFNFEYVMHMFARC